MVPIIGIQGGFQPQLPGFHIEPISSIESIDLALKSKISVLVTTSRQAVTEDELAGFDALRVHIRAASGDENVDLEALRSRDIRHLALPEPYAPAAAQHTMALMLGLFSKLPMVDQYIKQKHAWIRPDIGFHEISELTLGIIGFGHVGSRVFQHLSSFCPKLWIYDPYRESSLYSKEFQIPHAQYVSEISHHLPQTDVVVLCAASRSATSRAYLPVIDKAFLKSAKPGIRIINTSRAEMIDEESLMEGLTSEVIGGCALDVFWEEPLPTDHWLQTRFSDRVILSPHLGSRTAAARDRMVRAIENAVNQMLKVS